MKNTCKAVALSTVLIATGAFAADDHEMPMSVNSTTSGESVVSAPASGMVTRAGKDVMTIRLVNNCFPTNLRAVSNPLARSSLVKSSFEIIVGGTTYKLWAEYPAAVAAYDLSTNTTGSGKATGPIANMKSTTYGIDHGGGTAAVYGNVVEFKTKIPTQVSVDANANITVSDKGKVVLGDTSFYQTVKDCNTGPVFGDYGWSSKMPTYGCGEFMGKTGDVTASIGGFNVSADRSVIELQVSFPGETAFCGGFWSPLMVFFDENRPTFKNSSDFPLVPGSRVAWPEANAPGWFIGLDRDASGSIDQKNELFGDNGVDANGFDALKAFDSNHDGVIDKKDKVFKKLVLWQDKNGDGIAQKSEMVKLSSKITKISLKYENAVESYGKYAEQRQKAKFWYKDAKGKVKEGVVADIWLAPQPSQLAQK